MERVLNGRDGVRPEMVTRVIAAAFRRIAAGFDPVVQVQITFLEEGDAAAIANHVSQPSRPRAAMVIAAPDNRLLPEALAEMADDGTPTVQVITCIVPSIPFVGIDN